MSHPHYNEKSILDGRFILVTENNEFAMSHWVNSFLILDGITREKVLDIPSSFHLEKLEEKENVLHIVFQIHPDGATRYNTVINPDEKTFMYKEQQYDLANFAATFKG